MKLSLILPVCNAAATLGEQLDAIAAQEWAGEWEVIIADNGSTDDSLDIARSYEGRIAHIRLVDASDRRGAGHARNKGAAVAEGETIAFIDADDVIGEGWMAAVAQASEKHDFMATRFEYRKLCDSPEQEYGGGTQIDGFQRMWWPPFYPHSGGGGIVIKKSLHEAVGGFDCGWLRLQDTDYCIRLYQRGVRLHFVRDAVIHIRNRSNLKGVFRQARLWGRYNALLYKRYRLKGGKLPRPFRRFFRDAYRALKRIIRGPINSHAVYQLGWHVGLLQGCLMYRVAPPMVGILPIPDEIQDADQSADAVCE